MSRKRISSQSVGAAGFFTCLVLTLATAGLTVFMIHNFYEQKQTLGARQEYKEQVFQEIESLKEFISLYNGEQERLGEILFSDQDIATFLEEISLFAKQAKVNIVAMRTKPFVPVRKIDADRDKPVSAEQKAEQETMPQILTMPIDIQVQGEFRPLVDFLIHLEKHRQLITLSDVEIKLKMYPQLSCSFTLNLYSLKQIGEKQG